jgi:F0F1-type ATP synthase membrane subunit c/vacuolar-type H+-ATPase subunit K
VALGEWADLVEVDALDRFVSVLALNREATDLGRLIAEEARSIRRDVQRELVERMEARGQQVWIPVTVATLVPGVIFIAIPFMQALRGPRRQRPFLSTPGGTPGRGAQTMRTVRRPWLVLATALAVGVAACGAGTALTDAMAARSAVMETMANPKVITVTFDAAIDLDELNQLVGVIDGADEPIDGDEAEALQTALAALSAVGLTLAHDDQSVRMAATWSGQALVDIRMASDAPEDQDPTEPFDLTMAFRYDQDVVDQMLASFASDDAEVPTPGATGQMVQGYLAFLGLEDGPIGDAAAALEAGEWVTIEGQLDSDAFGDGLFVTPGDTPDIDEDLLAELFGDAITLSDPEPMDGARSRSSVTLDVGALVRGFVQLATEADPSGDTANFLQGAGMDEFDLSIRDAMTLTFDGDLLTEARTDLIELGLQAATAMDEGSTDDIAAARQVIEGWTSTRLTMVATISEHGTVGDQLADVSGGATLTWDDLDEVAGGLMRMMNPFAMGPELGLEPSFGMPLPPDHLADALEASGLPTTSLDEDTQLVMFHLFRTLRSIEGRMGVLPAVDEIDDDTLAALDLARDGDVLRTRSGVEIRFFHEGWDMCVQVDTADDTLHMWASYRYEPMSGAC